MQWTKHSFDRRVLYLLWLPFLGALVLFYRLGGDGRGALGGVGTLYVGGSSGVHSDSLTAAKPNSNTDHDGAPKDEC